MKTRQLILGAPLVIALTLVSAIVSTGQSITDKPAEQAYKNIQVFKGLPSSQLFQAMFYMRGALGVTCTNCHVNFQDFDKDDNPNKQTARKMILMVRELNQNKFGGRNEVTCNTCHRGHKEPVAPLAFATIKSPKSETAPSFESPALRTVDEVIDRYIEATGGKAAQARFSDRMMAGSMLSSEGFNAPLRIIAKSPQNILITFDISWVSYRASSGVAGWSQDNHGLHDLTGNSLAGLKREGALFQPLRLKEQYSNLRFLGKEKLDGRDVFVLEGTLVGSGPESLYFDASSGLLTRVASVSASPLGPIPSQITLEDYREIEGVKIPFLVTRQAPDYTAAYKIDSVTNNIPAAFKFDKPIAPLPSIIK